jgi:hypothetical protein
MSQSREPAPAPFVSLGEFDEFYRATTDWSVRYAHAMHGNGLARISTLLNRPDPAWHHREVGWRHRGHGDVAG